LTNIKGKPLREHKLNENGRVNQIDGIKAALTKLIRKNDQLPEKFIIKKLRKTSASLLMNNKQFRHLSQLFLGHAPTTMQEKHYASFDDDTLDEAISWLGEQYGIE
jgi:hypothetical protein